MKSNEPAFRTWARMIDVFRVDAAKLEQGGILGRAISQLTPAERRRRVQNCSMIIEAFQGYRERLQAPDREAPQ